MDNDLVFYQFSRSKVERGEFSHFLSLYAPEKLPTGRRLRQMLNTFVFCIEGWDDDPREIHSILEVRRFYSAFHEAWPYWLYFCKLDDMDTLKTMVMCCLPCLTEIKVDGQPDVGVRYDPSELLPFLARDFGPMNALCERAEMFEDRIYGRTREVFEYFDLPFETTQPPDLPPPRPR